MGEVEIIFSSAAVYDLREIEDYISKDSERMAKNFIERIFQKIILLQEFPGIGRIVPEFNDISIKELILGNYRIIYHYKINSQIHILRVIHGARLLELGS